MHSEIHERPVIGAGGPKVIDSWVGARKGVETVPCMEWGVKTSPDDVPDEGCEAGFVDARVAKFVERVAGRLAAEPDLDDFLGWSAGTLEYWIHIVAASVGRSDRDRRLSR